MTTDTLRPEMFTVGQVRLYPTWKKDASVGVLTSAIGDYHFGDDEIEKIIFHVPNTLFKYVKEDDTFDISTRLHCRFNGLKSEIRHIEVEQHHGHVAMEVVKDNRQSWTKTIQLVTGNIEWFCSRATWEPHYHPHST